MTKGYRIKNYLQKINLFKRKHDLHPSIQTTDLHTSVAFISFHKCATTYFTSNILNQHPDYQQVDYQKYLAKNIYPVKKTVHEKGYIYGVLRLLEPEHPLYRDTIAVIEQSLSKKLRFIFWVRDPRDILVSMYYSFGYSHTISSVPKLASYQMERRTRIQQQDLETFVLESAEELATKFLSMHSIMQRSQMKDFLRYEDMINDFETFRDSLKHVFPLSDSIYEKIYLDTRPKIKESIKSHRRSGRPGQYEEKLSDSCIQALNDILEEPLTLFRYL